LRLWDFVDLGITRINDLRHSPMLSREASLSYPSRIE
jgi:hypothetical protein